MAEVRQNSRDKSAGATTKVAKERAEAVGDEEK